MTTRNSPWLDGPLTVIDPEREAPCFVLFLAAATTLFRRRRRDGSSSDCLSCVKVPISVPNTVQRIVSGSVFCCYCRCCSCCRSDRGMLLLFRLGLDSDIIEDGNKLNKGRYHSGCCLYRWGIQRGSFHCFDLQAARERSWRGFLAVPSYSSSINAASEANGQ